MLTHTVQFDNGRYDFYARMTLEGCVVTIAIFDWNWRPESEERHELASEAEARAFYEASVRRYDSSYRLPSESESQPAPHPDADHTTGADLELDDRPPISEAAAQIMEQLMRPAWKPIVQEGDGALLASKFSGQPWLAPDEPWPGCPCCANPMQLFVQLNLDELPVPVRSEFGTGLLQLFYCCTYDCPELYEPTTIYYGRVPYLVKHSLLRLVQPTDGGSSVPIPIAPDDYFPAQTIVGWQELKDYPQPEDLVALHYGWEHLGDNALAGELYEQLELYDSDEYEETYVTDEGDKLAGYPRWVQGIECPGCPICQQPMHQVFQLASEDHLPYAFGDLGIGHVLQCPTHKDELAFVWACG